MLEQFLIMVQKDPNFLISWIASFFGWLLNFFYDFSAAILPSETNTLGLSIILLTLVAKIIVLPLGIKSQKSMMAMQAVQPEIEKIQKKYKGSSNPEDQKRMSAEVSQLYSKHKANPMMGCLPIFVQMPIFMALYYIMNQSYRFIDRLYQVYSKIVSQIWSMPDYVEKIADIAVTKVPNKMSIDLAIESDFIKVLGKFTPDDWNNFFGRIPSDVANNIEALIHSKSGIETFFSMNLTETIGLSWPSIILPIICVLATFLQSYISSKQTPTKDENAKMQQTMMMIVMPVMMGFITVGMPAGVGLYWAISNILQIIQQFVLNKIYRKKKNNDDIIDMKPEKAKPSKNK